MVKQKADNKILPMTKYPVGVLHPPTGARTEYWAPPPPPPPKAPAPPDADAYWSVPTGPRVNPP